MKKTFLIMLTIGTFFSAQAQKMATVNSNDIVMNMPETKALQDKIQTKSKELGDQLQTMYKQFEDKAATLKGVNPNSMNAIQEAQMAELQDLQKRIEKFEQSAQKDVQQMEQTLSMPILEKAKKAIDATAKAKAYTHVFDVSSGGMIVYPVSDDITNAVKQSLGIPLTSTPATMNGGSATGGK